MLCYLLDARWFGFLRYNGPLTLDHRFCHSPQSNIITKQNFLNTSDDSILLFCVCNYYSLCKWVDWGWNSCQIHVLCNTSARRGTALITAFKKWSGQANWTNFARKISYNVSQVEERQSQPEAKISSNIGNQICCERNGNIF